MLGLFLSGDSLWSGDFLAHNLSLGEGDEVFGEEDFPFLEDELPCFRENAWTALIGPCLVVDGDPFRRTRWAD